MRKDVKKWYKECLDCAESKGPPTRPPTRPHGKLRKVFAGAPLDLVAIDILSGLPVTPDGLKYILVVTDYFSKWTEAYGLRDPKADALGSRIKAPTKLEIRNVLILACKETSVYYTLELSTLRNELIQQKCAVSAKTC